MIKKELEDTRCQRQQLHQLTYTSRTVNIPAATAVSAAEVSNTRVEQQAIQSECCLTKVKFYHLGIGSVIA